jgi:hypothetical protein
MPITRKKKSKVLKVDSEKKIAQMEKMLGMLGNGSVTIVLIYADWCGACKRFMKNVWNPTCNSPSRNQRIAVREDIAKNTSLANANFKYLPSLIAVENGRMNLYKGSEGLTNAMPTPTNIRELKTIINKPVMLEEGVVLEEDVVNANNNGNNNVGNNNNNEVSNNNAGNNNNNNNNVGSNNDNANNKNNNQPTLGFPQEEPLSVNNGLLLGKAQQGKVYKPTPQAAPQAGGNALPAAILGSLAMLLKKTRKAKKLIKSRRNK